MIMKCKTVRCPASFECTPLPVLTAESIHLVVNININIRLLKLL